MVLPWSTFDWKLRDVSAIIITFHIWWLSWAGSCGRAGAGAGPPEMQKRRIRGTPAAHPRLSGWLLAAAELPQTLQKLIQSQ